MCSQAPRAQTLGSSAAWKLKAGAGDFCSNTCARKALYLKAQLSEVPAWEREHGHRVEILLHEDDRPAEDADAGLRRARRAERVDAWRHKVAGEEELARPVVALLLSGLAAGLAITISLLAELYLRMRLPDERWAELVYLLGYPVGYVIVIMGRLQLFTESTVTAVLPVAARPSMAGLARLARLWSVVLTANLIGVLVVEQCKSLQALRFSLPRMPSKSPPLW